MSPRRQAYCRNGTDIYGRASRVLPAPRRRPWLRREADTRFERRDLFPRWQGTSSGSAIVEIWLEASGVRQGSYSRAISDSRTGPSCVIRPRSPDADCLWIESTYGDRLHRAFDATRSELIEALHDVLQVRHGNVIIPHLPLVEPRRSSWCWPNW